VHYTYFTLPVLFIMISNHYPFSYSHSHGWLVAVVVMLAGVLIRQFFVLRHKGIVKPWLPLAACALLAGLAVALAPSRAPSAAVPAGLDALARVEQVMQRRCVACHAAQPTQPGFAQPPKGVLLQTREQLQQHAAKVGETVASRYMPIGNLTGMTDEERGWVAAWAAGAVTGTR
jgi:uncharacterized membrane protein